MRALSLPYGSHTGQSTMLGSLVATLLVALPAPLAFAVTTMSQGYTATQPLSIGSLVSLQENSADTVVPASTGNVDNTLGVIVNRDSSLLSVTNSQKQQVQVATSGTVRVLVSDINGAIKRGDHITASQLNGVGMKATANVRIVGIAQGDMQNTKKQMYKDKNGREHSVTLGDVPVLVNVAYFFKEPEKTIVPGALQNVANSLAGREVSTLPILLSIAVFVIMLIVVSSIVYSMIRSSIISVGRNPMSQSAIYRDLIQLSLLVLIILGVGMTSIYLILTRL